MAEILEAVVVAGARAWDAVLPILQLALLVAVALSALIGREPQ